LQTTDSGSSLKAVFSLFLRLGFTAFGGPAAHIALMEEEVVRRRRWVDHQEFLDLLGATNFIPGPNSTEMAIHIGYRVAGWRGLWVAGLSFILPAAFIVSVIAAMYVRYGGLPEAQGLLYGIKPVLIAVIFQAVYVLGKTAVKSPFLAVLGAAVLVGKFFGIGEIPLLLAAASIAFLGARRGSAMGAASCWLIAPTAGATSVGTLTATLSTASLSGIFFYFLKVGSLLFGSGYVLFAFMRTDLVDRLRWLTEPQLLDAIAVGQFTPGPVFTAATFVGYLLGGGPGAALATLAIFLPAFIFVALSAPYVARLRNSPRAARVLDGVNVASLAILAYAGMELGKSALVDFPALAIAIVSTVLLLRFRLNSTWLLIPAGVFGYFRD
jgi:chromate transporter